MAGSLAFELGNRPSGGKLLDDAAEMIAKASTEGRSAYYRGVVAESLALYDLNMALALADSIKEPHEHVRHLSNIAVLICTSDLHKAMNLIDKIDKVETVRYNLNHARMCMAYYLADAGKTGDALRVVENMKSEERDVVSFQAVASVRWPLPWPRETKHRPMP